MNNEPKIVINRKIGHPLSALNQSKNQKLPGLFKAKEENIEQQDDDSLALQPKNTPMQKSAELISPSAKQQLTTDVVDIDKQPDKLWVRFGFLVRSKSIPKEKVIAYLCIVVKGLHYSLKCLKPPSLKFIQSKKIKLKDPPAGKDLSFQTAIRPYF